MFAMESEGFGCIAISFSKFLPVLLVKRMKDSEDTTMPDPVARKRLKKRMLDRWENEGGSLATDTTSADASRPTGEDKGRGRKRSSPSDNSSVSAPASPTKRRKPAQK